jgi:trans-aconitate methyltransferase
VSIPAIVPLAFEKRRFRSAAAHYLAGRPRYAHGLIARVAALCGLTRADRVMDLGCGPGMLAFAFAPLVAEVVGIDPEPEMLRAAAEHAADIANIRWIEGSSYDLSPRLGTFALVTMGRSFHWMDRVDTLRRLDGVLRRGGVVANFFVEHPKIPHNAWLDGYRAVRDRFKATDDANATIRGEGWVRHEGVLLDSAFAHLERIAVYERRTVTRETMIERALSMSGNSREKIGDAAADAMVAALRAALPPDAMEEVTESVALLAWRPGEAP